MMFKNKQSGFTIVELLIVIVVIAVLASITVAVFNGIQGKAKFTKINSELLAVRKSIEMYHAENGTYPPTGTIMYQRMDGNNYIPGIVPTYAISLPKVTDTPVGWAGNDTYIYASNAAASGYMLQRLYQPTIPSNEWANVPSSMKQGANLDRYGYGKNYSGY